jgi:hypothetical protein
MILPGLFQHYKGAYYRVLFVAKDSNNGPNNDRNVVVYVSLSALGRVSTRYEDEFDEDVQNELNVVVKRFTRIGD